MTTTDYKPNWLRGYYYEVDAVEAEGTEARFELSLRPDCGVYAGHFPGRPVCPGVFGIGMVKECAMQLAGCQLFISSVRQCRLTSLATPDGCPRMQLRLALTAAPAGYRVEATLAGSGKTILEFAGEMQAIPRPSTGKEAR